MDDEAEDWEMEGWVLFAPIRNDLEPEEDHRQLVESSVDRVKEGLAAREVVEFGTTVLVREFLVPVLDLLGYALDSESKRAGQRPPGKKNWRF